MEYMNRVFVRKPQLVVFAALYLCVHAALVIAAFGENRSGPVGLEIAPVERAADVEIPEST